MPADQKEITFPKRSQIYLLICVAGVVLFILVALYPSHRSMAHLEREIAKIRSEIEGKKVLSPLFTQLLLKVRAGRQKPLPFPTPKPLPEEETGKLSRTFAQLARQCDLKAESVLPDLASLEKNAKTLRVDVRLSGGFFDFRRFLLLLGEQPFLQGIDEIRIREIPGARHFRVKLRLLIG